MNQIVVKIEDKFISEAFQKWCFEQGINWCSGSSDPIFILGGVVVSRYCGNFCLSGTEEKETHYLPNDWEEATAVILEMIKPKEKKWTDDDMIRFFKSNSEGKISSIWLKERLSEFN